MKKSSMIRSFHLRLQTAGLRLITLRNYQPALSFSASLPFAGCTGCDAWARPAGIEAGLPEEKKVTTQYVWKPNGLYVFKGDTVELTVINNAD